MSSTEIGKISKKSQALKAAEREAKDYTGPIEFAYKGVTYRTMFSGDCSEMYQVTELLQDDKYAPALKALLDMESYVKYRETKPVPSDAVYMIVEWSKAAKAASEGESQG